MSNHTKELWSINDWPQVGTDISIGATGTPLVAKVPLRDVSINEQRANARRIVACVNACSGVATELLSDGAYMREVVRWQEQVIRAERAEAQRDELLAALRGAARCLAWHEERHGVAMDRMVVECARAAIANMEEQP